MSLEFINIKELNDKGRIGDTPAYQRLRKQKRVDAISRNFDEVLWGLPVLSLRDDGKYYAVDGQHRILAASRIDRDLPVRVIRTTGSTHECEKKEAVVFVAINTGCLSLSRVCVFEALRVSGDERCIAICNEAASHGIVVSEATGDNTIGCVGHLYSAYESGCQRKLFDCLGLILKKKPALYKEIRKSKPTEVILALIHDGFFGRKMDTGETVARKILAAFRKEPARTIDLLRNAPRQRDSVSGSQKHVNLFYEFLKNPSKGE